MPNTSDLKSMSYASQGIVKNNSCTAGHCQELACTVRTYQCLVYVRSNKLQSAITSQKPLACAFSFRFCFALAVAVVKDLDI